MWNWNALTGLVSRDSPKAADVAEADKAELDDEWIMVDDNVNFNAEAVGSAKDQQDDDNIAQVKAFQESTGSIGSKTSSLDSSRSDTWIQVSANNDVTTPADDDVTPPPWQSPRQRVRHNAERSVAQQLTGDALTDSQKYLRVDHWKTNKLRQGSPNQMHRANLRLGDYFSLEVQATPKRPRQRKNKMKNISGMNNDRKCQ